ncbi:MAG: family 16 glycosylhydrolase [Bacteroidales bacterium]
MKTRLLMLMALMLLPAALTAQEWELVWADEFDGSQLDTSRWSTMTGDGTAYGLPSGWGNNELQYYRAENVEVTGGNLVITAKRQSYGGKGYTSGRIRTLGKGDWTYARIEFRARMPLGQGLWAAIWMLPSEEVYGGWAASGEIDIVENLGHEPLIVYGTLHYGGQWPNNRSSGTSYTTNSASFAQQFHDFALEWEEGEMRWYVDGNLYQTQSGGWYSTAAPFPAPFNREFHLLVNLAVGGNWPGDPEASTQFPQELTLDYIRVYQRETTGLQQPVPDREQGSTLGQNFPNPFSASTTLTYRVTSPEWVSLELYDALGRRIRTVEEGTRAPGTYRVRLEGTELPKGLYVVKLRTGQNEVVRRITRL